MDLKNKKILITGGRGFFGTNLTLAMADQKYHFVAPSAEEYDFRSSEMCLNATKNIDVVLHLAAQVGGISFLKANPGEVFYNNVKMGLELLEASRINGVKKFVTIGSVCEYPDVIPLPFKESDLWNGYPALDTSGYGLAKKTMLAAGQMYKRQYNFDVIHIIPVNLYGPHDHFGKDKAHVIPALVSRIIEARESKKSVIEVWGSGKATREFIYIDDAVNGVLTFTQKYEGEDPVNLGTGEEVTIKELVEMIVDISRYKGKIFWDKSKPEGTMRRQLDVDKAAKIGFVAKTRLFEGLKKTISWYEENRSNLHDSD